MSDCGPFLIPSPPLLFSFVFCFWFRFGTSVRGGEEEEGKGFEVQESNSTKLGKRDCDILVLFLGFGLLVWGDMGSRVGSMHTFVGRWCALLKAFALLWNIYCRCWISLCWWKDVFSLLLGFGLGEEALLLLTGCRTWLLWELCDLKPIFGWV